MIKSSIKWSLMLGGLGDCRMKTSSSRTEEWICTLVSRAENLETWQGVSGMPSLMSVWFQSHAPLGDGLSEPGVAVA